MDRTIIAHCLTTNLLLKYYEELFFVKRYLYFTQEKVFATHGIMISGMRQGIFILHNGNHKISECHYLNNKREGKLMFWYSNGIKQSEKFFSDDLEEGIHTEWYSNGEKHFEINYLNGSKDGMMYEWNSKGEIETQGKYKDGERIGEWRIFP